MKHTTLHRAFSLIFLLLVVLLPHPARAQSGACPDETNGITTPTGWYPGASATCVQSTAFTINVAYGPDFPCGSAFELISDLDSAFEDEWLPLVIVPPAGMPFPSGQARIAFVFEPIARYGLFLTDVPFTNPVLFSVRSYNAAAQLIGSTTIATSSATPLYRTVSENSYYNMPSVLYYEMQVTGIVMAENGFLELQIVDPPPPGIHAGLDYLSRWFVSSFRLGDSVTGIPPLCDIPGALPTATPTYTGTPTATGTATATGTPTETATGTPPPSVTPSTTPPPTATGTSTPPPSSTPTYWPTAPGGTMTPPPTPTAMVNPTVIVNSPTPYPASTVPAIVLPTLSWGGYTTPFPIQVELTPDATSQAYLGAVGTQVAQSSLLVTRWYTNTNQALGVMITGTTGITTTTSTLAILVENISAPVRYVKTLEWLMPRSWPFILMVLISFAWITFITFWRYGRHTVATILETIRKLIEMIPGM